MKMLDVINRILNNARDKTGGSTKKSLTVSFLMQKVMLYIFHKLLLAKNIRMLKVYVFRLVFVKELFLTSLTRIMVQSPEVSLRIHIKLVSMQ